MDNNVDNNNSVGGSNSVNTNVNQSVDPSVNNVNSTVNHNVSGIIGMQEGQELPTGVEQSKSYININNLTSRSNGRTDNTINAPALDKVEEMTEERRAYLLEKEQMITARKKRKRIVTKVVLAIIILVVSVYGYQNYFRPVKIDERIDKNSIHYLTDLYYSDGRYYEKYLDEKGKKVYLDIFNGLKDVKTSFMIDCRSYGYSDEFACSYDVLVVFDLILLEHPDMFWYRYSSFEYVQGKGLKILPKYVSTNKVKLYFVERRLLRKIDDLAKEYEDLSDYEKIKSVYTWLGQKRYSDGIIKTRKDGTAWSALLEDDTVCAGYAAASQLLFQRLGIESTVVTGNTTGPHAWNFVYLEDGYYYYDATVAGSVGKDSPYFYYGLLLKNVGDYSVDIIDLDSFTWGKKYLES